MSQLITLLFKYFYLYHYNLFSERTEALIAAAGQIKQTGATGAYSHEFESMEEKIADVQNILLTANLTSQNLASLSSLISELT